MVRGHRYNLGPDRPVVYEYEVLYPHDEVVHTTSRLMEAVDHLLLLRTRTNERERIRPWPTLVPHRRPSHTLWEPTS